MLGYLFLVTPEVAGNDLNYYFCHCDLFAFLSNQIAECFQSCFKDSSHLFEGFPNITDIIFYLLLDVPLNVHSCMMLL